MNTCKYILVNVDVYNLAIFTVYNGLFICECDSLEVHFVRLNNKYSYQNYFVIVENTLIYNIYNQFIYLHHGHRWLSIIMRLCTFIFIYCTVARFYVLLMLF